MTRHLVSKRAAPLCAALMLAATQAFGAVADGSNDGGGSEPPDPASSSETGWNPIVRCVAGRTTSLAELFECLAIGIDPWIGCPVYPVEEQDPGNGMGGENPNGGAMDIEPTGPDSDPDCNDPQSRREFVVNLISTPRTGIRIVRKDGGGEPASLFFKEDSYVLQWTTITLNHSENQVARIGEITEWTTVFNGRLKISLNSDTIEVPTGFHVSPSVMNQRIVHAIAQAGYTVRYVRPYILVEWDTDENRTVTHLGFHSLDNGIVRSEIRLEPLTGPPNQGAPVMVQYLGMSGGMVGTTSGGMVAPGVEVDR